MRFCTLNVPSPCGQPAVEKLIVREYPWADERIHYRCAEHPAEGWVPIITKAFPMAETEIVRLDDEPV